MEENHDLSAPAAAETAPTDFIREIVRQDLASGKYRPEEIRTRFPPEPNGYLHIGHAKAICLDFGVAKEFGGKCNLRMDDTNPGKEDREYYDAIQEDIAWLGYQWDGDVKFASDYFPKMYEFALLMIKKGLAYVDDQSAEEIRATRGTPFQPGVNSPWRDRSVEENLDLFQRMKDGEFPNGSKTLRAKIDMAHPNINLRDPVMYRILHEEHERTGNQWCIYPMYDWAHGLEDSLEGVTHSLCTLEFEIHRPLYNWFLEPLPIPRKPRQIEFSRLNLTYTVMSKRKLLRLVQEGRVSGWDDPRMPTVRGFRRRGYTPSSIRNFVAAVGITKFNGVTDMGVLENTIREELNHDAPRYMAVLHPLKVTLTNYPEGRTEWLEAVNNPEQPEAGTRKIPFGRHLLIEQDDFQENPPPKYFRMAPGREVRLRWGYFIRCQEVVKDDQGKVVELLCTYDPETRGGNAPDGRKVKGTIHWVEETNSVAATVREYDRLFLTPEPDAVEEGHDFIENLNPDSLKVLAECRLEPGLGALPPETRVQFERLGYFVTDWREHRPGAPVFNKTVSLKDSWAKIVKKG